MESINVLEMFGGVPFIDNKFDASSAITAVCCVRACLDGYKGHDENKLLAYLEPFNAYKLAKKYYNDHPPIYSQEVSYRQLKSLKDTKSAILLWRPDWINLFRLPVQYMILENTDSLSLTNPVIPQFIFFSEEAFKSKVVLQETLVHEMAHVWLSLLNEITPLVDISDKTSYTLPSGTSGKTSLGVLLAIHFSAAALGLLMPNYKIKRNRIQFLYDYLIKSLAILEDSPYLTSAGKYVWLHINNFAQSVGGNID